ncbi:hypothetical protein [Amycolatopsis sp. SID8362]|uniref:hypothetical protein n=1 Tax=Amycolatopsis sp. SID8362 TaxID=2690346 RepID=UPI0013685435|nr:hypothetical protein [Amycolatopsis sp. SID8362]NBH06068.1 hypothetical protein [Amycolatopsis sp. SID8362]NED42767.1 hypothetical protein [Amycolatopsis sp. SID8362]
MVEVGLWGAADELLGSCPKFAAIPEDRRQKLVDEVLWEISWPDQVGSGGDVASWVQDRRSFIMDAPLCAGLGSHLGYDVFIKRFVANLKGLGFRYTQRSVGPERLLNGEYSGDCSAVSRAAAMVCNVFYEQKPASVQSRPTGIFVVGGGEAVDGQFGNVDGAHWVFENRHWVKLGSRLVDVLLCGTDLDTGSWIERDTAFDPDSDGRFKEYEQCQKFGELYVYRRSYQGDSSGRYTLDRRAALVKDLARLQLDLEQDFKERLRERCRLL